VPFQDNIISVDEIVPNQISSSRVRYNSYRHLFIDSFICYSCAWSLLEQWRASMYDWISETA